MEKLISYILSGKKWKDIGINDLYGNINIASTDPVSSSPGATYYGLLLSILSGGELNDQNVDENLPKLKEFYEKSGYMNNTPADLFERYLKTGMGGEPMIVDYEKSIIDFSNSNKDAFDKVKNDIVVIYPKPTIWNSHCRSIRKRRVIKKSSICYSFFKILVRKFNACYLRSVNCIRSNWCTTSLFFFILRVRIYN